MMTTHTPARYVLHNLAFRCRTLKQAIAEAEAHRKATGAEFGIFELRERVAVAPASKPLGVKQDGEN